MTGEYVCVAYLLGQRLVELITKRHSAKRSKELGGIGPGLAASHALNDDA